jgi:hypothetical protein
MALLMTAVPAMPQAAPPNVDRKSVDAAIEKGAAFLLDVTKRPIGDVQHPQGATVSRDDLVLFTLI